MSKRRLFTDYEKKAVYVKYNGHCAICGKPVKFDKMTIDHKIPLSKGGANGNGNLQLACRECNFMKNGLTTEEFQKKVREVLLFNVKNIFVKGGTV